MESETRSLSVILPVYNEEAHIAGTLEALGVALRATSFDAEIIVVDDGSTDGTAERVEASGADPQPRLVRQENRGRFEARRAGLEEASGHHCLLVDGRVRLDPGALSFVEERLAADPRRSVWNGHVNLTLDGSPYATFWDVLTQRAYWTYFGSPRTTSFELEEFDRFPKGTGCLFAPRETLLELVRGFRSGYGDVRYASDDTRLLRGLAANQPINISPGFSCAYSSRTRLIPFLRHAFHRGTMFPDSHGPESSWFPIVLGLYAGSALVAAGARRRPGLAGLAATSAALSGAAVALSVRRPRDVPTMMWVTPLYAAAHVAGMWRGLAMLTRDRGRRRT
jgi:glycosyltransferase involved in cell wall biosynthesis